MERELKYAAALRAARERMDEAVADIALEAVDHGAQSSRAMKDAWIEYRAIRDAYEALARAVGAFDGHRHFCTKRRKDCSYRAEADRLAAPFLSEVKA